MTSEPQKARILVESDSSEEPFFVEVGDCLTIGRSKNNQIVIDDPKASRRHAEIQLGGHGRHRLSDLGSVNGTWLNGRRLTAPKDLLNGDEIRIGGVQLLYMASTESAVTDATVGSGTAADLRVEWVVVLVSDIRNYTGMSENLPQENFSSFIMDWFAKCKEVIDQHGGLIDKFIGDAVMAYWTVLDRSEPAGEIRSALDSALALMRSADEFSVRLSGEYPEHSFRIGVGISMGDALLGNIGTGELQSFTLVGDTVNLAFRLESLTKEKKMPIIVSGNLTQYAGEGYSFSNLGETTVKGRAEPVSIAALAL